MNSKPEGAGARACWFVGATYGGTDDQTLRFLQVAFAQLGVLEQGAFKTAAGNEKAWPAIQKTAFQDIHVDKGPERMPKGHPH